MLIICPILNLQGCKTRIGRQIPGYSDNGESFSDNNC